MSTGFGINDLHQENASRPKSVQRFWDNDLRQENVSARRRIRKKSFMRAKKPLDWGELSFDDSCSNLPAARAGRRDRFCGVSTAVWM